MAAITRGFDLLFAPLAGRSPWWGLAAVALVTAAVALLIFRAASNQRAIRATKDRIIAHLLEVVLYRDDLRVVVRAQARLAADNARYLGHALAPLVLMVAPVGLIMVQADLRYGRRPLRVGESAVVTVGLRPTAGLPAEPSLAVPAGVVVETPAVVVPARGEVSWRVRAHQVGEHELRARLGDVEVGKRLLVAEEGAGPPWARAVAPRRPSAGVLARLLNPAEPPLPSNRTVAWVEVTYPEAPLRVRGRRVHWVWPFFALTLAFGYALKGPLRVQL